MTGGKTHHRSLEVFGQDFGRKFVAAVREHLAKGVCTSVVMQKPPLVVGSHPLEWGLPQILRGYGLPYSLGSGNISCCESSRSKDRCGEDGSKRISMDWVTMVDRLDRVAHLNRSNVPQQSKAVTKQLRKR